MTMNRWTPEQKTAIEARDCSLIVSAAAGSGKTSVLVERLIRIIADSENRVPVEKMIIATFTKDAAAEMKQRLAMSLSALIENSPDNAWLTRQSAMLSCAHISTISSFCIDLLRSNISQLPFSGSFRILDEAEEKTLRATAFQKASDYFYSERINDMKTLRDNFCDDDDAPLERMIYSLYKCVSSVPFFEKWIDGAKEKFTTDIYRNLYIGLMRTDVLLAIRITSSALRYTQMLDFEPVTDIVAPECEAFAAAVEHFIKKDYNSFAVKLMGIDFVKFSRHTKGVDPELKAKVKEYRDSYIAVIKSLKARCSALVQSEADKLAGQEILRLATDFLAIFSKELLAEKHRLNAIGFDDTERLALGLLTEENENGEMVKSALANELSDYYELIMIDEFQDSNNRQDMIFRLLSKGGTPEKYGSNLFFVGDVKQAIYKFRLANPDNFINAMKEAVPYEKGNDDVSYIRLSRNFRSSAEVITLTNYIFSCIMTPECGDVDYNEDEYLYQGAQFCDGQRAPVVMLIDRSDKTTENIEAKCVAAKIAEMIKSGYPVSTGKDSSRPCEPRDFAILLRKNKNINLYAKELEALGIPATGTAESGYLKARETTILINLLRVVDNPLLDTPLMSVMLSPMCMFTADDAARIRLINKKATIYSNLCTGLGLQGGEPLLSGEIFTKAKLLHSLITELRLFLSTCTLTELIRKIYDRTDFLSVMQLFDDAERKKANLRLMLEYAGSYEKNSDGGLSGFIRYIDRVTDSGGDFMTGASTGGTQNAVFVSSMHKSKGLEFPFVFIAESHTEFMHDSKKNDLFQFSYDMGLGFRMRDMEKRESYSTIQYDALAEKNRIDTVGEEMRLLYVALTRAKERIFITLDKSESAIKRAQGFAEEIYSSEGITPYLAASVKSMSDWLYMCLLSHSKSAQLREDFEIYESFRYDNDFEIQYIHCEAPCDAEEKFIEPAAERAEADSALTEKLHDMFSFDYDTSLSSLTAKLAVSEISKGESDFGSILRRPEFAREEKGLTPAEKGTALHKFLQFADFTVLSDDPSSELQRLYDTGYLSKRQMEAINLSDVEAFTGSEVFKMVKECKAVHREKKFLIRIDDLELSDTLGEEYRNTSGVVAGIIDMVLEFDDHLVLIDYKTDRISDISELAVRYSSQLDLYRRTLARTETKPVSKTLIYSFHKKAEIEV